MSASLDTTCSDHNGSRTAFDGVRDEISAIAFTTGHGNRKKYITFLHHARIGGQLWLWCDFAQPCDQTCEVFESFITSFRYTFVRNNIPRKNQANSHSKTAIRSA